MLAQLSTHRPLHQPAGQIGQQAARAHHLALSPSTDQQLVDQLIGQPLAHVVGQPLDRQPALAQPGAYQRLLDQLVRQPVRPNPRGVRLLGRVPRPQMQEIATELNLGRERVKDICEELYERFDIPKGRDRLGPLVDELRSRGLI
jgi:hypothetical protein